MENTASGHTAWRKWRLIMRKLSAQDASFIYLESDHSPMHIGGVYLIDARDAPDNFNYATFHSHIQQRLHRSKIFRQRLVEAPLSLSHPSWINDPDFDLGQHLPQLRLPPPGGKKELMQLSAQIFGRALDRKRPLWELSFVEGLDAVPGLARGSYALITKLHHAAVDGGSGIELMGALMDPAATPRHTAVNDEWRPEQLPAGATVVASAYAGLGRKSAELGKLLVDMAAGALRVYSAVRAKKINPPPMPWSAPASILNRPVSSSRTYWGVEFDFERIRQIRLKVPGVTVNDVLLAQCAAALRTCLLEKAALPERSLITMSPVSVRGDEHKGEMGNQVSAMLVSLATDLANPLQRLLQISRNTRESKIYASALPANRIAEFIPSGMLAAAARLCTRTRLGGRHRPFFNLVITNVPGFKAPRYLAGARIAQQYGMAPILDGLGLSIVVLSYAGRISLGLTSCYSVLPNPAHLGELLEQALRELEDAIAEAKPQTLRRFAQKTGRQAAKARSVAESLQYLRRATSELDQAIRSLREKTKS